MKKLDLYIIRKFLSTFFFIVGIFVLMTITFDVSERIDEFIDRDAPLNKIITDYYVNLIIYFGNLYSSFLVAIAVLFFTSMMASKSEFVAILSSGVSFNRILLPYIVSVTIITGLSLFMNHWVVPITNKKKLAFEYEYLKAKPGTKRNVHKEINTNERVYMSNYNTRILKGYNFSFEKWDGPELIYKLDANSVVWDTVHNRWKLNSYIIRTFDGKNETIERGPSLDTTFNIHHKEFMFKTSGTGGMNYTELNEFIEKEREKGSEMVVFYEIEKHQRTSLPFANYVLMLISVSLSSRKVRGGIGVYLAAGFAIIAVYLMFIKTSVVFATNANLAPSIAVWIPNVLFLFVGLILYKRAPK
ncbi:MAG: LptF/LptG family permease [Flavobacteriales bacterium]|nr:LptF/LptG family permease [Flavobacteriales bacterium]